MNSSSNVGPGRSAFAILVALRLTLLRNILRQALADWPLKLMVSAAFIGVIWIGLFLLFDEIFAFFEHQLLEAAVVIPVIFNIFFLSLLILLAFSNAVLVYGSLFGQAEPGFLLAAPVPPVHLVLIKYLESLFFASWSLLLLGVPLMLAAARQGPSQSWVFFPLFIAFFLCFVPIPGALGLVLAWLCGRFFPRRGERMLLLTGGLLLAGVSIWTLRLMREVELMSNEWTTRFFAGMDLVQAALLPSTWVAKGIEQALQYRYGQSMGYLAVTAANALFLSMLAVWLCGRSFLATYDRAITSAGRRLNNNARTTGGAGLCAWAFFYLPRRLRWIAAKDLRTFFRDPMQWSQLAILFGLMGFYLLNMPRFFIDLADSQWGLMLPFLNLCAVSLMLATFTSRFVFPLVSLEGHQLWLLNLLPISKGQILLAKFAYAATVTVPLAAGAMLFAARAMNLPWGWALLHLFASVAICVGLCGLAVGLGARLPMFGQTSAGRIANGFGGTVNLIASMGLIVLVLGGMAAATLRARNLELPAPDSLVLTLVTATAILAVAGGAGALYLGAKHLRRVEI
ncbi:MAG: hypothetical protein ACE5GE_10370 [Phycisphaerae bacterium]